MDYKEKGTRYLTLTVDDGNGGTDSVSFGVIVVDWPEPPPPDDVTVTPLSPTVLSVTWTAPDMTGKPPVEGYSLRYVRTGSTLWKEHYMQHGFSGDTEIIYLDPDTSYDVQVVAHNDEGSSSWSASVTNSTLVNSPPVIEQDDCKVRMDTRRGER